MNNFFYAGDDQSHASPKLAESVANGVVFPRVEIHMVALVPGRIATFQGASPSTVDPQ